MTTASFLHHAKRHLRLTAQAHGLTPLETPPYLALFVTSACNLNCEHCGVHERLNRADDLRFAEFVQLSEQMGRIECLHVRGGEPCLRDDLAEICTQFIRHNAVRQLQLSTNGYHAQRLVQVASELLAESTLHELSIEIALEGLAGFHNRRAGDPHAFEYALASYDALAALAARESRLVLRVSSTVSSDNLEELEQLSLFLHERCPSLQSHDLRMLRAERKNPCLRAPSLERYVELRRRLRRLWSTREAASVQHKLLQPALDWVQTQNCEQRQQVVSCKAGILSAVVYANGDVSVCETQSSHPSLGNLRQRNFRELWNSPQAQKARTMIRTRQCACANELFLWPSVAVQPLRLVRELVRAKLSTPAKPVPLSAAADTSPDRRRGKLQLPIAPT